MNRTRHHQTNPRQPACAIVLALLLAPAVLAQSAGEKEADDVAAAMTRAEEAFQAADIVGAIAAYRSAAERGHAPAQTRLGQLLDTAEQNAEAARWYREAADNGDAAAAFGLGGLYAAGEGVERDQAAALRWITQAAEQGFAPAIRAMAIAHEKGQLGLTVSYDRAVSWLRAGVAAGDGWSIARLSRAYRRGELGLRIDTEQAQALEQQGDLGAQSQ